MIDVIIEGKQIVDRIDVQFITDNKPQIRKLFTGFAL